LRNAIDHGLESPAERLAVGKPEEGTILLSARSEKGQVSITVQDDGRGIDIERVKAIAVRNGILSQPEADALPDDKAVDLIFRPGFSTAETLTKVSGRGVGMDIVRTNIENLNGMVLIETDRGQGTRIQIILPLTLAIVPSLLVHTAGITFAIPLTAVTETLRINPAELQALGGRSAMLLRGNILPLARLTQVLDLKAPERPHARDLIVSVRSGKSLIGLIVDGLIGHEQIMVKSMGLLSGRTAGVSGAAILGDGGIALILDIAALFKIIRTRTG
jgi:two-component system chemotaxis sensor kinase CheA